MATSQAIHPLCKKFLARTLHTSLIECHGMRKIEYKLPT